MEMHNIYLPFKEQQLLSHFANVRHLKCEKNPNHLKYYKESIKKYNDYLANNPDRLGKSIKEMEKTCQIEKDEKFWIAQCMMTIFHSQNKINEYVSLFEAAYGETPPIEGISDWEECFKGKLNLFFEVRLPSPNSFNDWLLSNYSNLHIIPYILDSAHNKTILEKPTIVDALLLNQENGFAAIIEAKVLSDISHSVVYDIIRNQIARNIDVMLENNNSLCDPLNMRDPNKTLFLIITPKIFKDFPTTRLYGYKFYDYTENPESLAKDLPHRKNFNWQDLSKKMGWLTWEDFKQMNKNCCQWL